MTRRPNPTERSTRTARRADQRGMGVLEVLIALLILGITVGGIATATLTAGGVGKDANKEARLNVLMTAFGEAIKALPYEMCALPTHYESEFRAAETQLPAHIRRLIDTEDATLEVRSVSDGGTQCTDGVGIDSGVQAIELRVVIDGEVLDRQITKRTDAVGAEPLSFCIKRPVLNLAFPGSPETDCGYVESRSGDGDTQVVWYLEAGGSSRIFQYEWWCDGSWALQNPVPDPAPPADFTTFRADDASVECSYVAPTPSTPRDAVIALRVTDENNRTAVTHEVFPLSTTPNDPIPPVAEITQTAPSQPCNSATPCPLVNGQIDLSFLSSGPAPLVAGVVQWEWSFGDGTPALLCRVSATDMNGDLCRQQTHTFVSAGEYAVRLRLTDAYGISSNWATLNISISGPVRIRPTVGLGSSLTGNPPWGVSPQWVNFDASGSHADGFAPGIGAAAGIVLYEWDYGVPESMVPVELRSGPNLAQPSFRYVTSQPTTFNVTVTVTATNGATNTATMQVRVEPLLPPIGIANNGARKSDIWLIRNAYFDFQWRNPPAAPGDTMVTEIRIRSAGGGFCGFVNLTANPRVFSVPSGAPGSVQGYRAQFDSSPRGQNGICSLDSYMFEARTVKTNAFGTEASPWSTPTFLNPEFF